MGKRKSMVMGLLAIMLSAFGSIALAEDFTATTIGNYENVTVMEFTGNYDTPTTTDPANAIPRQVIAKEFYKTHKDDYDFLVIFTNFDFQMPVAVIAGKQYIARGFYQPIKNDITGIGEDIFDNTGLSGSNGKLHGAIDMGYVGQKVMDSLDPKFEETMTTLSHELLHRWSAYIKFEKWDNSTSKDLLGSDDAHWSFLLDTKGSMQYGNPWIDNGDGTFTSLPGKKYYSPLDLYLMGLASKEDVAPMLLIENPQINKEEIPQAGIIISGTPHYVNIDDIIAAEGQRIPDFENSQKSFKLGCIYLVRPGTFEGREQTYALSNVLKNWVIWFSSLTKGRAIAKVDVTPEETVPINPGVTPPPYDERTAPPSVNDALAWLLQNQKPDGSWQDSQQTVEKDTAESVLTLISFPDANPNVAAGIGWLSGTTQINTDYLARKIEAFNKAKEDTSDLVTELLARRNADGGWGSNLNFESNPSDTAWALRALSLTENTDEKVIQPAIDYLKKSQNPDGGWGGIDKESTIQATVNVLCAFIRYQEKYPLAENIQKGLAWLFSKQNEDGGFGNSPSTIYDTALALSVFKSFSVAPEMTDKALIYMLNLQNENGSWYSSPYQTALALKALALWIESAQLDLVVTSEDISFDPLSIITLPQETILKTEIRNTGLIPVPQVEIALYEGAISASNKVDQKTIAVSSKSSTLADFKVTTTDGKEHAYFVVIDPDQLLTESNRSNNKASKVLKVEPDLQPDLCITEDDITLTPSTVTVLPQDVEIKAVIKNLGRLNVSAAKIEVYDGEISTGNKVGEQTLSVPGKSSATAVFNVNIVDEKAHQYHFIIDPENQVFESDKSNNSASKILYNTASIDPDLSVRNADISFNPQNITVLPEDVTIQAVIWNYGMTAVTGCKVAVYDGSVNAENKVDEKVMDFPSRTSVSVTFRTTIKDGQQHRFYVVADPDNLIEEIYKTNNTAFNILYPKMTYDLEVLSSDLAVTPAEVEIGKPVTIKSKIANHGTADAFNVLVKYTIKKDDQERSIATLYVNVPAGQSTEQTFDWVTDQIGNSQKLTVQADPNNQIPELSEANNAASTNITILPLQKPNLVVTSQDITCNPDPANETGDVTIGVKIRNEGAIGTTNAKVVVYKGDPALDGVLLHEELLDLDAQSEKNISFVWSNSGPAGKQVLFVKLDPENAIPEIDENDNQAMRILTIHGLPDLIISPSSIEFDPVMPRAGTPLNIIVRVQNAGEQYVPSTWVEIYEGATFIGRAEARFAAENAFTSARFVYDTTGKEGAHGIQITVDPENSIKENNESNNSATADFAVQNADLWVTERYLSPNGDGIKDSTQFFFALKNRQTVGIQVFDSKNRAVRIFNGPELENTLGASIIWNGLNEKGAVVADGSYQIQVVSKEGMVLSSTPVVVDNNRSPLRNAIGTKALVQNNLTCELPNVSQREWFPDESGLVFCIQDKVEGGGPAARAMAAKTLDGESGNSSIYPGGLYCMSPNGEDILRLVPAEWESDERQTYIYGDKKANFVLSPDGEKIAFALTILDWGWPDEVQLWVVDRYGKTLQLLDSYPIGGAAAMSVRGRNQKMDGDGDDDDYILIKDIQWAADSSYLTYITHFYACCGNGGNYEDGCYDNLRVVKADGSGKQCLGTCDSSQWSPRDLVYVYANWQEVMLGDTDGNKSPLFTGTDQIESMRWLNPEKILVKDLTAIWLVDAKGSEAPIKLAEIPPLPTSEDFFAIHSDGKRFAFVSTSEQEATYKVEVCDEKGDCKTCHESQTMIRDLTWSRSGSKLAFFEEAFPEQQPTPDIYKGSLVVLDFISEKETVFETEYHIGSESEYNGYGGYEPDRSSLKWLGDDLSLVTRDTKLFVFDSDEQEKIYLPTGVIAPETDVRISPQGHYITYEQKTDQNSICRASGDRDVWSLGSLLNLTADLTVKRNRSVVILKGTVMDLNFAYYTLEYADKKDPLNWHGIVPYANIPVIDDVFTSWAPPYEGTFLIRLTVYDLAGNHYSAQKQVSWDRSSSIINLRKVREIFSPILQDPTKNTAELHYRVLEPVSLVFYVYDKDNNLIRKIYQDYAAVPVGGLDDFIIWDGTDAGNHIVLDDIYKIKVFDYEFFYQVDTLAPLCKIELRPPEVPYVPEGSKETQKYFEYYYADLFALTLDKHLKQWNVEYGSGDNPQEWNLFLSGNDQIAATDELGDLVQDQNGDAVLKNIKTIQGNELELAVGKKFRITAEDLAGNKSTLRTDYLEEVLLLEQYVRKINEKTYHFRIIKDQNGNYITWDGAIGRDDYEYNLIQSIDGIETIRAPLARIHLQYQVEQFINGKMVLVWTDGAPVYNNPPPGFMSLVPDTSDPYYHAAYAIRIKAVDENGKEYFSNAVALDGEPPLIIPPSGGGSGSEPTYPEAQDCQTLSISQEWLPMSLSLSGVTTYRSQFCYLYAERNAEDYKPLACFDILPEKDSYNFQMNVSQVLEGIYRLKGIEKFSQEYNDIEIPLNSLMIIDRTLPEAEITYPTSSVKICPVKKLQGSKERLEIAVEGLANDAVQFKYWELHYGLGTEPSQWYKALNPQGEPIQGKSPLQGQIGVWDVTGFSGDVSLRLKVVDYVGNVNCYTTHFYIDTDVSLQASVDRMLFSPNGDGKYDDVLIHYALEEYGYVNIHITKQLADQSYEHIRALLNDKACDICTDAIAWDGKDDNGQVTDGNYRIVVSATDVCGNQRTENLDVELDVTPPLVEIAFPRPDDALGTVIEVKGTATDRNFDYYKLRIEDGSNPGSETLIAEAQNPLQSQILGKWNRFNQEGTWILKLKAEDKVANLSETTVTLNLGEKQNLIADLDADPKLFSPNRDGKLEETTISYTLNSALNEIFDATLEFYSGGNLLKSVKESGIAGGRHVYIWDGDVGGSIAPDGAYTIILTAALSSNPLITQREKVTVILDKTPPVIEITEPIDGSYVKNDPVAFKGSITDANLSTYDLSLNGPPGMMPIAAGKQNRVQYTFAQVNDLAEEHYELTARAEDLGLISAEKRLAFIVDRTPPKVAIQTPKEGELFGGVKGVVAVKGTIEEKNPKSWVLRYGAGDNPDQWTVLAQGEGIPSIEKLADWNVGKNDPVPDGCYTIALYAVDKAGWESETRVKIWVDNRPPDVEIISPKGYITKPESIQGTAFDLHPQEYVLELSGGDCNSAFQWLTLDTGRPSVNNGPLGALKFMPPDGSYCIQLSAKDQVGNQSQTVSRIIVDTTPPGPPVLSGKIINRRDGDLSWIHEQESDFAGYNLYRDGKKINTQLILEKKYLDQQLNEGLYTYVVKAADKAGLESRPSNEVKLQVNLNPPKAKILSPLNGSAVSGLVDIKGTAFSDADFKEYRLYIGEGSAPATWALIRMSPVPILYGLLSQWDTFGLPENSLYSIKLEAEDLAGNLALDQIVVRIDNQLAAEPVLDKAEVVGPNLNDVDLAWHLEPEPPPDDIAGYLLYRNDQLANVAGTVIGDLKPYLIANPVYLDRALPDGTYTYYVVAMDKAGNLSKQSNTKTVTIESGPPKAVIIIPEDGHRFMDTLFIQAESKDQDIASIQFQYQATGSGVWIKLGQPVTSRPYVTYLDPLKLNLTYGDYRLNAVATDLSGQSDPDPEDIGIVYIDTIAPQAPINLRTLTDGGKVTLTWDYEAEKDLSGYNIYRILIDSKEKLNPDIVSGSTTYIHLGPQGAPLVDDKYTYEVRAQDIYGNESKPSNQADAVVYTPLIEQLYTPSGVSNVAVSGNDVKPDDRVDIYLSGTSQMAETPITSLTADEQGGFGFNAALQVGENWLWAKAADAAGNKSKISEPMVVVFNEPPATPTGFKAVMQGQNVNVTWNPNTEADLEGYNLFRDEEKINASSAMLSGSATASVNEQEAAWAFDQNPYRGWNCHFEEGTKNQWWQLQLESKKLISSFEIEWYSSYYAARDYEVQVWSGYAWITREKVIGNQDKINSFEFTPAYRTDKIRIWIPNPAGESEYTLTFNLVEVRIRQDNVLTAEAYQDPLSKLKQLYKLTAVDYYGFESPPTEDAPAGDVTPPDPPLHLQARADYVDIILDWTASSMPDLAGYNVYRRTPDSWIKVNSDLVSGTTTYTDHNLPNGTYTYRVTALDIAQNESQPSNEDSATINIQVPSEPINLKVEGAPAGRTLKICWEYQGGPAAGYNLYRALSPGGPYVRVNKELIQDTCYLDTGLKDGIKYYYIVLAVDQYGNEGIQSNEDFGIPWDITPPDPPVLFHLTISGLPLNVDKAKQDIAGWAEPGALVELFKDGKSVAKTKAYREDQSRIVSLCAGMTSFSLSQDGQSAAYICRDDSNKKYIWIADLMSGNAFKAVEVSGEDPIVQWSPDNQKLVYNTMQNERMHLYLYDRESGAGTPLTYISDSDEYAPAWSRDGTRIAFISNRYGFDNIWVKELSAGSLIQVARTWGEEWFDTLQFSPDDSRLAYIVDYDSSQALMVVDLESGNTVTAASSVSLPSFDWSPNGKRIAYISAENDVNDLYVLELESGKRTRITNAAASGQDIRKAVWSPYEHYISYYDASLPGLWGVQAKELPKPDLLKPFGEEEAGFMSWLTSGEIAYVENTEFHQGYPDGYFMTRDVHLSNGDNFFQATATDEENNVSLSSEPIDLIYDPSAVLPDLEILPKDIMIYPAGPIAGDNVRIYALVHNRGAVAVKDAIVQVYLQDSQSQVTLIKYDIIPFMDAGSEQVISCDWNSNDHSGENQAIVVLDPYNRIAELSEDNNMAYSPFYVAQQEGLEMTTVLNAEEYQVYEDVLMHIEIHNSGPARDGALEVRIEDENGDEVYSFEAVPVALPYGATRNFDLMWNTGLTHAGHYHVRSLFKEIQTTLLENIIPFSIIPEIIVTSDLTTDKIHYGPNENVLLDMQVTQNGRNYDIPLLQAKLDISNSVDVVLFSKEYSLENVTAGSTIQMEAVWNTALAPAGLYKAKLEVFHKGLKISESVKTFEIETFVQITGTIKAVPVTVFYGYPVQAAYTVANTGNASVDILPIKVLVTDPETQDIMADRTGVVDLNLNNAATGQFDYSTSGYGLKSYQIMLQGEQQGVYKTLATTVFTVKDGMPPVVTIIAPENGSIQYSPFNLRVKAVDDISGVDKVQYRLDQETQWGLLVPVNPATSEYGSRWVPVEAEEGPHTIWFRASDRAGNVSEPVATSIRIVPRVDMKTTLNAEQYSMNEDVAIKVNLANMAWAKNVALSVTVADPNGVVLHAFDPINTVLAIDESRDFDFTWNTGLNPAGPYIVQAVLTKAGAVLAEQTVAFNILPVLKLHSGLLTDKAHYGLKEDVRLNLSVTNTGNASAPLLSLKLKIRPEAGQDIYTKDLSLTDLAPNQPAGLLETWNTAQNPAGNYLARLEVYLNSELACFSETGFAIDPVPVITGALDVIPLNVPQGENYQVHYTVRNAGNTNMQDLPVKVLIRDANQSIVAEQQALVTLGINESKTGSFTFSSLGYNLGSYQAILQAIWDGLGHDLDWKPFKVIDVTPPVVTILTPANGSTQTGPFSMAVTAVDDASGVDWVEYQVDGGTWQRLALSNPAGNEYSQVWIPVPADQGPHTIAFQAADKAGNVSTPVSTSIIIDLGGEPFEKLTGTLQAAPNPVYLGLDESFQYSIHNEAGQALNELLVKILVIDPTTQETKITLSEQINLAANSVHTATLKTTTTGLALKTYQVVLKVEMSAKQPRELAETAFEVIASLEADKIIKDQARLLVWVNDHCPPPCRPNGNGKTMHATIPASIEERSSCQIPIEATVSPQTAIQDQEKVSKNCGSSCKDCINLTLLKEILDKSAASYKIVFDKCTFSEELRNPIYTDILILGEQEPLTDHAAAELREKVYGGVGLISALWLKHGCSADYDELFGITYKGQLPYNYPFIETVKSPITDPDSLYAKGKPNDILAANTTLIAGWIKGQGVKYGSAEKNQINCPPSPGKHPAIVLNNYGAGKAIYFAFDLGLTLNAQNQEVLAKLIANSIQYVHRAMDPSAIHPYELVAVELKLKSLGGVFDLRISETFPEGLEIYEPQNKQWISESPWTYETKLNQAEAKNILYYYLAPDQAGLYQTNTEVDFLINGEYVFFKNLPLAFRVEQDTPARLEEVIAYLQGLSLPANDKAKAKNAVQVLQAIKARIIQTRQDVALNIRDLLKAIESLRGIQKVDMGATRLKLDHLLMSQEALYYLFVPPDAYLEGKIEASPNPVRIGQEVNFHLTVANKGDEAFKDLKVQVIVIDPDTRKEVKVLEQPMVLEGNSTLTADLRTRLTGFKAKTYHVLLKAYSALLTEPKVLAEGDLTVTAH